MMDALTDHERLKNLAASFQSVAVGLAVVGGGVWTAFTFSALRSRDKALAELEESERKIRGEAVVTISFPDRPVTHVVSGGTAVTLNARMENHGTRTTAVSFPESALRVARLRFDTGAPAFDAFTSASIHKFDPNGQSVGWQDRTTLRPTEWKDVPFIFVVDLPGIYFCEFSGEVSPLDETRESKSGIWAAAPSSSIWKASTYVDVQ